uniref:thioredoxin n=1 Tax=uncultured Sphingomonas sp. TaxID=158754 RepID=UPI0035CB93A2
MAVALIAGGATTAVCFGDALGLVPAPAATLDPTAIAPAPSGATSRPIPVLENAKPWLTEIPGGVQALHGKVVLVNFWTYSCINSLRALPYLRAWNARYGDKGLVVVGVHTPEFRFEHDPSKVRIALRQLGVSYSNLQDNDFGVWQDFANEGWPGFYFVDANGRLRGYRVGEGHYADAEQLIRTLLGESGHNVSSVPMAAIQSEGSQAQADWSNLKTGESYLGYAKADAFAGPGGLAHDAPHAYAAASKLKLNQWTLAGNWNVGREFATAASHDGTISFRFHARDAHLVLGGAANGRPVPFKVTVDGVAPLADHGTDVDASGSGRVVEDRLYQLVRQRGPVRDRTVTITFAQPGVRAYVFTFG